MKIWCFDCDETLWCSYGPVTRVMLEELRDQGHAIGIVGNWARFVQCVPDWHKLISFFSLAPVVQLADGSIVGDKAWWMSTFRQYVPHEEMVMVGNQFGRTNSLGVVCGSNCSEQAARANIKFILEDDFAAGMR